MTLGYQLTMASQTIIVSRTLGLEVAAVWAVGTKMFNLIVPLMCRPYGASLPGLYEMLARGEAARLRSRFEGIVVLTASLGAFLGISLALCNSLFIGVWTNGRIVWSPLNDVLLGLWVFLLSLQTTHCNFVSVTKQIGGMRYVFFVEGCCFVLLAMLVGARWKLPGMIGSSLVCTALFSYQYSLYRSRQYFHCGLQDLAFGWVLPSWKLALVFAPLAAIVWFATKGLCPLWRLEIHGFVAVVAGGALLLRFGLPPPIIQDIKTRWPRSTSLWLGFLVR